MENQETQSNALSLPRVSFGKENLSVVRIPPPAPHINKTLSETCTKHAFSFT
jgi:hypothetical protein